MSTTTTELISLKEAAERGINRVRLPKWSIQEDHLEIHPLRGSPSAWADMHSPFNRECNGNDPVRVLLLKFDIHAKDWLPYDGPVAGTAEYTAAEARFNGCLSTK